MEKKFFWIPVFLLLCFPTVSLCGTYSYYLPYFSTLSGYWTGIGVRNSTSHVSANLKFTIREKTGTLLKSETKTLSPLGQNAFCVSVGSAKEGWIQVDSDQPITGLCFVARSSDPTLMFDVPMTSELSKMIVVPHVAQDATWDSMIMLCNPNTRQEEIIMRFIDEKGTALPFRIYKIPASGSGKYPVSDLVGGQGFAKGSVEIFCSGGIAGFALYHNLKTGLFSYAGINAVNPGNLFTWMASGTYNYSPASQSLRINWLKTNNEDSVEPGVEDVSIISLTETDMTIRVSSSDTVINWTRLGAIGSGITGTWKSTTEEENLILLINTDQTILLVGYSYSLVSEIPEKSISIDGNYSDWTTAERVYADTNGPDCGNAPGQDIREIYLAKDDNFIFLRMVLNGPLDQSFGYKFGVGGGVHIFLNSLGNYFYYLADGSQSNLMNLPSSYFHIDGNQFECKFFWVNPWDNGEMQAWCDQGSSTACRDIVTLGIIN